MTYDLPEKEICEKYLNGMSTYDLAREYGCSTEPIMKRLHDNGIMRSSAESQSINVPEKDVCEKYLAGKTINEIAKEYNYSYSAIKKRLTDNKIIIRSKSIDLPEKEICNKYLKGKTINTIAKEYKCSCGTIRRRLINNNIIIRSSGESNSILLPIGNIIIDYKNGLNIYELSKKYEYNYSLIYNTLKKSNIEIRSSGEARSLLEPREHICVKCGNIFLGNTNSQFCPNCNASGYCYKWDKECKEHNREKYNRKCFFCGTTEEENGRKHDSHHIDNNKDQGCNNTPDWLLVPLCMSYHGMTKGGVENRKLWEARILYLHKEYWS